MKINSVFKVSVLSKGGSLSLALLKIHLISNSIKKLRLDDRKTHATSVNKHQVLQGFGSSLKVTRTIQVFIFRFKYAYLFTICRVRSKYSDQFPIF